MEGKLVRITAGFFIGEYGTIVSCSNTGSVASYTIKLHIGIELHNVPEIDFVLV